MACSGIRKTKQCLTLKDKLEILKVYDSAKGAVKINELAKTLRISRSTLVTIVSNRKNIETAPESDRNRCRTRNKRDNPYAGKSKYQALDEALAQWVRDIKQKGEPFNGVILRNKALKMAAEMGFVNFTASNGWSDRFKKKYDFKYKMKSCYCHKKLQISTTSCKGYGSVSFLDRITSDVEMSGNNLKKVEFEEKLIEWLDEARNDNTKINSSIIKEMALTLAGILAITDFTASSRWLNTFQKKYYLHRYNKCGNCKATDNKKNKPYSDDKQVFIDDKKMDESTESLGSQNEKENEETDTLTTEPSQDELIETRLRKFNEISRKITKEEQYQKIKLRLDKMEVELEILKLAKQLLETKRLNMQLEIENLKIRLQILNDS